MFSSGFAIGLVVGCILTSLVFIVYQRYGRSITGAVETAGYQLIHTPYAVCRGCAKLVAGYRVHGDGTVTCHNCWSEGKR
jgi:hypothetical protein